MHYVPKPWKLRLHCLQWLNFSCLLQGTPGGHLEEWGCPYIYIPPYHIAIQELSHDIQTMNQINILIRVCEDGYNKSNVFYFVCLQGVSLMLDSCLSQQFCLYQALKFIACLGTRQGALELIMGVFDDVWLLTPRINYGFQN